MCVPVLYTTGTTNQLFMHSCYLLYYVQKNVAGNLKNLKTQKFKRGCYIFCRDAPPIPTAMILDESGAN